MNLFFAKKLSYSSGRFFFIKGQNPGKKKRNSGMVPFLYMGLSDSFYFFLELGPGRGYFYSRSSSHQGREARSSLHHDHSLMHTKEDELKLRAQREANVKRKKR
jgi:hypothetical protein